MSQVHLERRGRIAEIRLDNPARLNCLTIEMIAELDRHLEAVERAPDVGCLLLTAEGTRAFCAGADIKGWGALTPAEFARHWIREGHRVFDRLARLSKPTVAVLEGPALGGGLELATACDLRVMAPGAALALPEASVGITPGWSGTQRLRRLLPEPVLKEMVLFGRRIDAARAHALGFVADVSENPRAAAEALALGACALSPRAAEVGKWMIHAGANEDAAAMIEALGGAAVGASADREEGVAAFREKRKPNFPGV